MILTYNKWGSVRLKTCITHKLQTVIVDRSWTLDAKVNNLSLKPTSLCVLYEAVLWRADQPHQQIFFGCVWVRCDDVIGRKLDPASLLDLATQKSINFGNVSIRRGNLWPYSDNNLIWLFREKNT